MQQQHLWVRTSDRCHCPAVFTSLLLPSILLVVMLIKKRGEKKKKRNVKVGRNGMGASRFARPPWQSDEICSILFPMFVSFILLSISLFFFLRNEMVPPYSYLLLLYLFGYISWLYLLLLDRLRPSLSASFTG